VPRKACGKLVGETSFWMNRCSREADGFLVQPFSVQRPAFDAGGFSLKRVPVAEGHGAFSAHSG
jgi:hypothetical protein